MNKYSCGIYEKTIPVNGPDQMSAIYEPMLLLARSGLYQLLVQVNDEDE
jgi:hypothetical protein